MTLPTEGEVNELIADTLIRTIEVPMPERLTASQYMRLGEAIQDRLLANPRFLRSMVARAAP